MRTRFFFYLKYLLGKITIQRRILLNKIRLHSHLFEANPIIRAKKYRIQLKLILSKAV